jgi:very-short-patch-repair endonuclease
VDLRLITPFADRHRGLVTRSAALAAGWSQDQWRRAIRRENLVKVHAGVARLPGTPITTEVRIQAAVLALGAGALASHRSAALLWGCIEARQHEPVDVTLISRARTPKLDGVVVHRTSDLVDLRPIDRQGIPSTNPLRTLLDLGAVAPEHVMTALTHFAQTGIVAPSVAADALQRHSRRGRSGLGALRSALDEWRLGVRPPDSVLETAMADLLHRHRLPPVEFHARVAGYEVDFLVVGTRLVLECDGWAWHGVERQRHESDRRRDAELGALGYIVRRFTWLQIQREGAWIADIIRSTLRWAA